MQNLYEALAKILEKDERVFTDGKVIKNKVSELAFKLDKGLLGLLLENNQMKEHFFVKAKDGVLIFDQDKFIKFINNKEFLPDSFTTFKNCIGLTENDEYIKDNGKVVLAWGYKDCVLEGGQDKEDTKRDEIFYNEILAPDEIDRLFEPKVLTNLKKFDKSGEHKVKQITEQDNLIIKGNNLLVLQSIKKVYSNKIGVVYIDPPYNTGGDANIFSYNNTFNHSTWLTFMKNRLEIAHELLRDDGFIAVTIDHNELFYLGELADEIFGRENRLGIISIVIKPEGRQFAKFFSTSNEFMVVYAKNAESASFNSVIIDEKNKEKFDKTDEKGNYKLRQYINYNKPEISGRNINPEGWYPFYVSKDLRIISLEKLPNYIEVLPIENGIEKSWQTNKETAQERINNNDIVCEKDKKGKLNIFFKARESQRYLTHWFDRKYNSTHYGTRFLSKIVDDKDFSYPKSIYSVLDTLKIMAKKDDIILDFFAGSGTTGHAVLELNKKGGNRHFILVEQLDEHIDVCKKRIQNIIKSENIKNNFLYFELKQWNEEYMRKIQEAKTPKELAGIYKKMQKEAFFRYDIDLSKFDEKDFGKLELKDQKRILIECLDKNHLYVNYSEIDDSTYKVSAEDKKINKQFYGK